MKGCYNYVFLKQNCVYALVINSEFLILLLLGFMATDFVFWSMWDICAVLQFEMCNFPKGSVLITRIRTSIIVYWKEW